jgi:hypothetical protein
VRGQNRYVDQQLGFTAVAVLVLSFYSALPLIAGTIYSVTGPRIVGGAIYSIKP